MSNKDTSFIKKIRPVKCGGKIIDFSTPKIMGILNLTPDSFYDGGKYTNEKQQRQQVEKMLNEGAHFIDIGAVSTRPGARLISEEEELQRLIGPIQQLTAEFTDALFSVDTFRAKVARECIHHGAHMINDISGGNLDKKMFATVAELKAPYISMHMHGTPREMQQNPISEHAVEHIRQFFEMKVRLLNEAGVEDIILDPGFGFGKTLESNYTLLNRFEELRVRNLPLLAGISRKSMVHKVLDTLPEEALNGTTVVNTMALLNGANILRVHDVKEAREAIEIMQYAGKVKFKD